MTPESSTAEPAEAWSRLRTALVSDALDVIGHRRQCLAPGIAPLVAGRVVVGRAFTVTVVPSDTPADEPYTGLLRALDAVTAGEIFVYPTQRSEEAAVWGELISTSALARGVVGVVTDGLVRDVTRIRQLGLPVHCRGALPYDVNGRLEVVDHSQPVSIDGVKIAPRDLIVADDDGVVIVPADVEAQVIELCLAKDALEDRFREAVQQGEPAGQAFERLHVL